MRGVEKVRCARVGLRGPNGHQVNVMEVGRQIDMPQMTLEHPEPSCRCQL